MKIMGVVNVSRDSFSDGGRFLDAGAAVAHARRLLDDGADLIDLGAQSTHPDAEEVPAEDEIARLTPVVAALRRDRVLISIDTSKPEVMRAMLAMGVDMINDVNGFRDPAAVDVVRHAECRALAMHSSAPGPRAQRGEAVVEGLVNRISEWITHTAARLEAAGVARSRLVLDPGMGFFLGRDPALSVAVLRELPRLVAQGAPLCVGISRKSFLGDLAADACGPRAVAERGAAGLAAELWAGICGVAYIRTHDVRALRDAWRVWSALA